MAPESLVSKTCLDNGLRVLSESVPYVDSVSVGLWVGTGSRHERGMQQGASHFLEHMLFKGTERRSARQIADEMDMIGGHLNAFTDKEYTCFYAKVLSEHLELGLDLLSDMVLHSLIDPVELERERNVVLEEIKRHDDTPDDLVHDLFAETLWGKHPLGHPVIGSRRTVAGLTRETLHSYMQASYAPDRIIVAAAGNLDHSRLADLVDKEFCTLKRRPARNSKDPEVAGVRNKRLKTKTIEQVHFCIGTPGFSQHDDRKYTLAVIDSILGGGMSSRLFQEIRENRGLVYAIGSYSAAYKDAGLFAIYGGTSRENFDEVIGLITAECANLRDHNVLDVELERGKNQIRGALVLGQESMSNRMSRLAKSELYFGHIMPIQDTINNIIKVSKEDIEREARTLFSEPEFVFTAVGPFRKGGRVKI